MQMLSYYKSDEWGPKILLYKSIVSTILLYCSEVWAPHYVEIVERVQLRFFKTLLRLPQNTPNHFVRLEAGCISLRSLVFDRMLNYWYKILTMSDDCLQRACYLELFRLIDNRVIPFNWVRSLRDQLVTIGAQDVWFSQSSFTLKENMLNLKEQFKNHCLSKDVNAAIHSNFNSYFRNISTFNIGENYLLFKVHINKLRLIAQIRLASCKFPTLSIKGNKCKFYPEKCCNTCFTNSSDSLSHFIVNCPFFNSIREKLISKYLNDTSPLESLLTIKTIEQINDIYHFSLKAIEKKTKAIQIVLGQAD